MAFALTKLKELLTNRNLFESSSLGNVLHVASGLVTVSTNQGVQILPFKTILNVGDKVLISKGFAYKLLTPKEKIMV